MRALREDAGMLTEPVWIIWPEHTPEALTNTGSLSFHLAAGFREETRMICFRKPL